MTALLDVLLPGNDRWPAASAVLPGDWVFDAGAAALEAELTRLDPNAHPASVAAYARERPDEFKALLGAVYRAYYGAASVKRVITELANSGPRESLAQVDPELVAAVVRERRGQRRL